MKKGNVFPRTRSRWQDASVVCGGQNCPSWLALVELHAIYIHIEDGVPFPRTVTQTACNRFARWSYAPSTGSVVYESTWDDGVSTGTWRYTQRSDFDLQCIQTFRVQRNGLLGAETIEWSSSPIITNGVFVSTTAKGVNQGTELTHDLPWVEMDNVIISAITYGGLRSIGVHPDDTDPLTWDYE